MRSGVLTEAHLSLGGVEWASKGLEAEWSKWSGVNVVGVLLECWSVNVTGVSWECVSGAEWSGHCVWWFCCSVCCVRLGGGA